MALQEIGNRVNAFGLLSPKDWLYDAFKCARASVSPAKDDTTATIILVPEELVGPQLVEIGENVIKGQPVGLPQTCNALVRSVVVRVMDQNKSKWGNPYYRVRCILG